LFISFSFELVSNTGFFSSVSLGFSGFSFFFSFIFSSFFSSFFSLIFSGSSTLFSFFDSFLCLVFSFVFSLGFSLLSSFLSSFISFFSTFSFVPAIGTFGFLFADFALNFNFLSSSFFGSIRGGLLFSCS
jgi:hypothetical protein